MFIGPGTRLCSNNCRDLGGSNLAFFVENETSIQSDPMLEYKVAQTLPKVAKK